jgi:hypothetical protein
MIMKWPVKTFMVNEVVTTKFYPRSIFNVLLHAPAEMGSRLKTIIDKT